MAMDDETWKKVVQATGAAEQRIIDVGCGDCSYGGHGYECHDPQDAIRCFWSLNMTGNMDEFSWESAFDTLEPPLRRKLAEHGLLGPEAYEDTLYHMYGELRLEYLTVDTHFITVTEDEIAEYVQEEMPEDPEFGELSLYLVKEHLEEGANRQMLDHAVDYVSERLRERFEDHPMFEDLQELHDDVQDWRSLDDTEKALLLDRVIHAEHVHGSVYHDVEDIDRFREEFDEDLMEVL